MYSTLKGLTKRRRAGRRVRQTGLTGWPIVLPVGVVRSRLPHSQV